MYTSIINILDCTFYVIVLIFRFKYGKELRQIIITDMGYIK